MPWTIEGVDRFKKGLNKTQKKRWVKIANGLLRRCQEEGGDTLECEVHAVRIANSKFNDENYTFESDNTCTGVKQAVSLTELILQDAEITDEYQMILPVGTFQSMKYGEIIITQNYCQAMVDNWKNKVLKEREPFVDEMHNRAEAMGWIKDLKALPDGLYAKIEWTKLGKEKVEGGIYKYFSADIDEVKDIDSGDWIYPVLIAVALCNTPVMNTMPQVHLIDVADVRGFQFPFPGEHAARLRQPGEFEEKAIWKDGSVGKFKRSTQNEYQKKKTPHSIDIIWGKLKGKAGQNDPPIAQAIRFKKETWKATDAKKWLDDNEIKYISFEKASSGKNAIKKMFTSVFRSAILELRNNSPAHSDGTYNNLEGNTMNPLEQILKLFVELSDEDKKKFFSAMDEAKKSLDSGDSGGSTDTGGGEGSKDTDTDPEVQKLNDKLKKLTDSNDELTKRIAQMTGEGKKGEGSKTTQMTTDQINSRILSLEKANETLVAQVKQFVEKDNKEKKDLIIKGALKGCKILPKDKEFWENRFLADPQGTAEIINKLPSLGLFTSQGTGEGGEDFTLTETKEEKHMREEMGVTVEDVQKYG